MAQTQQSGVLTWIITRATTGLGRALAGAALNAGDRVVVVVRTPTSVEDLKNRSPDRCAVVRFDACDASTVDSGVSAYSASKFALEGWTEALAGEVAPFGIASLSTGSDVALPWRFRFLRY